MKKIIITSLLGFSALNAHAGSMGPVSTQTTIPYLGVDGSYTWSSVNGYTINGQAPSVTTNGWGGRLSVGADRSYTEKFSLNTEVGGGYYGVKKLNNASAGTISALRISGYDILAGGTYHTQYVDIFGDFGFMAQTLLATRTVDSAQRIPGGVFSGPVKTSGTQTAILPELKVGGSYYYSDKLSLTLSYMYVFGANVSGYMNNIATDSPPTQMYANTQINSRNPSLSTILLGLRYHFV